MGEKVNQGWFRPTGRRYKLEAVRLERHEFGKLEAAAFVMVPLNYAN